MNRSSIRRIGVVATALLLVAAAACGGSAEVDEAGPTAVEGATAPGAGPTGAAGADQTDPGDDAATGQETAAADAAADFYAENNELRMVGGHDAGSGFDFYMRSVARAMERVGDVEVTVQNVPGGGGLIGDNQLFEAEPDGLTFGLLNYPGHVFAQLTGAEAVRFDFAEWEWLARVAAGPPVILVGADSEYETAEDLINSERPVRFGIEEAGSDAFYGAALSAETFGFPAENITGYEGTSDIITAILRGEVDATFLSYGSALQSIDNGDARALMIFADEQPEPLPDVPLATEFASTPEDEETLTAFGNIYNLERIFVAPPGTPEDRVQYLRDLLIEAFDEEQFRDELEQAQRPVDPMPGDEVAEAAERVATQAETLAALLEGTN